MRIIRVALFPILFLFSSAILFAQTTVRDLPQPKWREAGIPSLKNYTPKEHGGGAQNWAIAQDARGVMYFGNNSGVLEYDGVSWRLIPVPNKSAVRSLVIAAEGTVYIGAKGEIGYLAPDSAGQLQYVSLRAHVPAEYRDFADIAKTFVTAEGVYFQALDRLLLWSKNRMRIWKPALPFHLSFVFEDRLYIRQPGIGLLRMEADSLRLLPQGEKFADLRIYCMLPFEKNKILLGTREQGLFVYDGVGVRPFPTEIDAFLIESQIYHGAVLADNSIALATLRSGVLLLDHEGRLLQVLNRASGIQNDNVKFLFTDRENGLWLALENGLTRAALPAPLSYFDGRNALEGAVEFILRHQGRLYVATSRGVSYLNPRLQNQADHTLAQPPQFLPVTGISGRGWCLLTNGNVLLAAVNEGVYRIEHDQAKLIWPSASQSYVVQRSQTDSARVYIGLQDGLAALRLSSSNRVLDEGKIEGVEEEIRSIVETKAGMLWLGTRSQGYVRVDFSSGLRRNPKVEKFHAAHGLPADHGWATVIPFAESELFITDKSLFRFDEKTKRFIPDSSFGAAYANGTRFTGEAAADRRNNLWLQSGSDEEQQEIGVAVRQAHDAYVWQYRPFLPLKNFSAWSIYVEEEAAGAEVVWFGGPEGLARYDAAAEKNYAVNFSALVRRVRTITRDSLVFGGAGSGKSETVISRPLRYANNALRFEFSASSYENEAANQFQYYLEGFDQGWSVWTKETKKDYTNLAEGVYRFHARAKNLYEHTSAEAVSAFKILPPWYRSWWAYLAYLGAFVWAAYRGVKYRTRQLEQRSRKLEALVQERTAELAEQKNNIELLSQIGKDLTASLDFDIIFLKLYESINQLADATIFGVGIYYAEKHQIEYRLAMEKGKRFAPYARDTLDKNQFPVWCLENRKPVFINDVRQEYAQYIRAYQEPSLVLEDGSLSETPTSLIYLPLLAQERALGVLTIQSYRRNAYTTDHLNLLQNLAAYTAIALDNANAYRQLNATLEHLKATQQQLVVQEKLASLGALTAGIAHEIKNPLNFVNNFAVLSMELAAELREEIEKIEDRGSKIVDRESFANIEEILETLIQNAEKINHHGKRADSIVKSMMEHSRGSTGEREAVDINRLLDEAVNLTYHGLRAQSMDFNITLEKDYDASVGEVQAVPQDLSRVFLNILNNACYAAHDKQAKVGGNFSPTLSVSTKRLDAKIEIRIRDNGTGIPAHVRDQIFNPFFTTKPTGKGTGLGLSISYDIVVQQHKGTIAVESKEGEFTEFAITLPKKMAAR